MLDPAILSLFPDSVTIEPFVSMTVSQVPTYGTAVTYRAQVTSEWSQVVNEKGQNISSTVSCLIPDRVHIDPRDRITLPSGWVPNQPAILGVRPVGGVVSMALDSTEILLWVR